MTSDESLPLDDEGFPSFDLLPSEDPHDHHYQNDRHQKLEDHDACQSVGGDFASDFYSCGTDWSCLLQLPAPKVHREGEEEDDDDSSRCKYPRFKQTDLFQVWGFPKPSVSTAPLGPLPQPPSRKRKTEALLTNRFKPGKLFRSPDGGDQPRPCPFYKRIPGTSFTVDAFRYGHIEGCSAYFLSHFHADHYGGLTKGWSHGPIYCTPLTARLVQMCISVNPIFIHPLEMDIEHVIEGVKVTFLEANHCPGAALIHFRLINGRSCLHTGDFRACKAMQAYPLLTNQKVNVLFLDTTYCNPKYKFPSKEDVLSFVVRVTADYLKKQPRTLVIVGAYSIGKECVYLSISEALRVKIYANASRRRILQSFGWPALSESLCLHGKDTPLHVLPISSLRFETLKQYLKTYADQYAAVLAFRPTGWTYSEAIGDQLDRIKPNSRDNITIYGVPYSEHSSFTELETFVRFLKPEKIVPTVNVGNAANRDKMQSYFRQWLNAVRIQ